METWLAMQLINGLILIAFGLFLCARTRHDLSRKVRMTTGGDAVRTSKERLLAELRGQVQRLERELGVPTTSSSAS